MTFKMASEIVQRVLSLRNKSDYYIYMNFADYTEFKKMVPKSIFKDDKLYGVEIIPSFKCPRNHYTLGGKD